MSIISFTETALSDLTGMKQQYLSSVTAPLDGMWEIFTDMADHYTIRCDAKPAGFCAINAEQKLMQFYLPSIIDAADIFASALSELKITGATVSTAEPHYLSLCLDHQKTIAVNALMYHAADDTPLAEAHFPVGAEFRLVAKNELAAAVAFAVEAIGADEAWLNGYYGDHIAREQLYGLWQGGTLMAAGELRVSASQRPYADVGMVVSPNQRGNGIATNILLQLRRLARENGLKAICSTEFNNVAAQKAIMRAGFSSHQRVLEVTF